MTTIPEKHLSKDDRLSEESIKEKILGSGSEFMPNVSRRRLLRSIRREKNTVARDKLLACRYRKGGMEHQAHLQNYGPALLHRAGLVVAHAGGRDPLQT